MQGRSENSTKDVPVFQQIRNERDPSRQYGEMGGAFGMLSVLERECLELREEVEHLNEKQEVLVTLMEGKMSVQKVALEKYQVKIRGVEGAGGAEDKRSIVQRKHKLVKWEGERKRARMLQGMELSGAVGHFLRRFGQFLLWFLLIFPGT